MGEYSKYMQPDNEELVSLSRLYRDRVVLIAMMISSSIAIISLFILFCLYDWSKVLYLVTSFILVLTWIICAGLFEYIDRELNTQVMRVGNLILESNLTKRKVHYYESRNN